MIKYLIEDNVHAIIEWEYNTYNEALNELKRRSNLSWDNEINVAPCISWKTCSKLYVIKKYDTKNTPYKLISEEEILEISSKWIEWKNN